MKFYDGYEIKRGDRSDFEIYYKGEYLESAASARNATDIVASDKVNRETIKQKTRWVVDEIDKQE